MNVVGYNLIAALAVAGAIVIGSTGGDLQLATALVGLAGTIAGRGSKVGV
jgi:hypothetical protein